MSKISQCRPLCRNTGSHVLSRFILLAFVEENIDMAFLNKFGNISNTNTSI